MTSAENSVSEPPNLKIWGGKIPPHKVCAFPTRDNAPRYKKPSYGPIITKTAKRARFRNTRSRCFLAGK